jgi:ABC-type oligopeptide transport system substrate-binding subunit
LSRNERYWNNAQTAIDAVNHHVLVQEVTELNRYRAGELHLTSAIPPDSFQQLREERPEEMHIAPYLGVYYYGFNLSKPPFKDRPELRKALSMAIDRDVLVRSITGRGEAAAYSWVPPGVDNYEPRQLAFAGQSQDERNALARRLIKEAGYGPDNPLRFELRYNTSDTHQRIALAVQSMWREALGVEATLVNEELQVLLANMRAAEVTQVFRSSWIGDYNDAHTFLSILQSDNPSNTPLYASDEYDDLMRRAGEQIDPKRRRLYLEEAERILLTDHPVIPLYFYVSKHLVSPEVRGWGDNVLDYHYSQHLSLAPTGATP